MQFCVIGLGRFGEALALSLANKGHEVLAIDRDEQRVQAIEDKVSQTLILDSTNEKAMNSLGLSEFDWVIVAMSSDLEASILTTMIVKNAGAKRVCAKAATDLHAKILQKLGIDKVVFPEREMGVRLAEILSSPSIFQFLELADDYSIAEVSSPKEFWDKTIKETDARNTYGVNIIAIKRKDPYRDEKTGDVDYRETLIMAPQSSEKILQGDILVVLGKNEDIAKLDKATR